MPCSKANQTRPSSLVSVVRLKFADKSSRFLTSCGPSSGPKDPAHEGSTFGGGAQGWLWLFDDSDIVPERGKEAIHLEASNV
jgi:hypothetical protein